MSRLILAGPLMLLLSCQESSYDSKKITFDGKTVIAKVRDFYEGFEIVIGSDNDNETRMLFRSGVCEKVTVGAIDGETIGITYGDLEITYMNTFPKDNFNAVGIRVCNSSNLPCPSMRGVIEVGGCP